MNKVRFYGIEPYGPIPNARQLRHLKMFPQKVFFHFGVNTFTDLEWGMGGEPEQCFAPTEIDVRQWIRTAAQAGATLAILTAKHHDGFCLWHSAHTEHCVKNSPYKNGNGDVVREFTDACREYGLGVGLYISPWDRNAPFWGTDKYSEYYAAQLTELMTEYGHIDEVWWDGAGSGETPYDWAKWENIIHTNQPDAAIFGSLGAADYVDIRWVGNECGYAASTHYATIDPKYLKNETPSELNVGSIITPQELNSGCCPKRYIPSEVDVSIRPGWFYHKEQDDEVKSVERLVKIWFSSVGSNAMQLINFPPDRRGLVCKRDAENARLANDVIKSAFSVNLAYGATVTASNTLRSECDAYKLLSPNPDCFFAAKENEAEILFELPAPITFDCYSVREVIELGERIIEHSLSAMINGAWVEIAKNTSIGNLKAAYFPQITASKLKFKVKGYAPPVLESFGLHKLPLDIQNNIPVNTAEDIMTHKNASIEILNDNNTLIANFGGIYPFNIVKLSCCNVWKLTISAFDGQKYYKIYETVQPEREFTLKLPNVIDGSYQVKIDTNNHSADKLDPHFYFHSI